jgi:hypothetical protein
MATYIFTDDADFKATVGKAINQSLSIPELEPTILIAAEAYLIPWIGKAQWGDLVQAVENSTQTTQQTALLPYVKRALAHLTLFEYAQIGEIQVSDAGFLRQETDHLKGAYKSQITRYERYMLHNGFAGLESMLTFLEANAADYPLWKDAEQSKRNREAFINDAATFQLRYSTNISRYVLETLRGLMLDVELFAIQPLIGPAFFTELKAAINEKSVSEDQETIIFFIQKAVALFTIEEGIRRNIVQNTGVAIVVNEKLEPQGNTREGAPDSIKLNLALRHNDEFGNRYIGILKEYLAIHRETYPTYDEWLTAKEEAAAAEQAANEQIELNNTEINTGTARTGRSISRI